MRHVWDVYVDEKNLNVLHARYKWHTHTKHTNIAALGSRTTPYNLTMCSWSMVCIIAASSKNSLGFCIRSRFRHLMATWIWEKIQWNNVIFFLHWDTVTRLFSHAQAKREMVIFLLEFINLSFGTTQFLKFHHRLNGTINRKFHTSFRENKSTHILSYRRFIF